MQYKTWIGARFAALALAAAAAADSGGVPVFTDGVASGDVNRRLPRSCWTRIDRDTNVKVEVWNNPQLQGKKAFQRVIPHVPADRDFTIKVDADPGCCPARPTATASSTTTSTALRSARSGRSAPLRAPARPRTPASPTPATPTATWLPGGAPAFNEFEVLDAARLEDGAFWVFDGDTIYADSSFRPSGPATTLAEYHATHRENRGYTNLRELLALPLPSTRRWTTTRW